MLRRTQQMYGQAFGHLRPHAGQKRQPLRSCSKEEDIVIMRLWPVASGQWPGL